MSEQMFDVLPCVEWTSTGDNRNEPEFCAGCGNRVASFEPAITLDTRNSSEPWHLGCLAVLPARLREIIEDYAMEERQDAETHVRRAKAAEALAKTVESSS